jgi:hypothetical protein
VPAYSDVTRYTQFVNLSLIIRIACREKQLSANRCFIVLHSSEKFRECDETSRLFITLSDVTGINPVDDLRMPKFLGEYL